MQVAPGKKWALPGYHIGNGRRVDLEIQCHNVGQKNEPRHVMLPSGREHHL